MVEKKKDINNFYKTSRLMAAFIRRHVIEMTNRGKSSHVGSGLSISDILGVLYGGVLNVDPENPGLEGRDRFILSKGHAGAAVYAALAEANFFPTKLLETHYQNGSIFSGHISHKKIPGVEFSTGSLGHGLSVGCGMALAANRQKKHHKVYVLMSDGECDEGSNWEAILFASHHKLNNLIVIVDYNKIQSLDTVSKTLELEPFVDKWKSFGWHALELDGHDHNALLAAFNEVKVKQEKPTVLICNTIKGKGVSFMENSVLWHYRSPQGEEFSRAIKELENEIAILES